MNEKKLKKDTPSPDQQNAIYLTDTSLLVSAAAGSGKTFTLVERIVESIRSGRYNIDELLVVTFTNAAAAEMKERVEKKLMEEARNNPGLQQQLVRLPNASISTLHSFCQTLIRQNFTVLDLDPKFRLGGEQELGIMKQGVLEELFEEKYAEGNEAFLDFTRQYGSDRDDELLHQMVLRLYKFSQSQSAPAAWLDSLAESFDISEDAELTETPWYSEVSEEIGRVLQSASDKAAYLAERASRNGCDVYVETLEQDKEQIDSLIELLEDGSWDELKDAMAVKFSKLKTLRGGDPAAKEEIQSGRKDIKKVPEHLTDKYFFASEQELLEDLRAVKPLAEVLCRLTKDFAEGFQKAKKKKGMLDFNDLEHYALQLLRDENGQPTDIARSLRSKYKEVMVDEYQDTNGVQEAILQCVQNGYNMFVVGDIKQSIYRFRLADPMLFLKKQTDYAADSAKGRALVMKENYRSRSEVLGVVNFLFAQLMVKPELELDYDADAALYAKADYGDSPEGSFEGESAELLLVDTDERDEEDDDDVAGFELEAHAIAKRLLKLKEENRLVFDKDTKEYRPIRWKDMAILMRAVRGKAQTLVEVMRSHGVPTYAALDAGYFEEIEVRLMLALLDVIDNAHQDIPLAAVLHSTIGDMTAEELAELRVENPEGDLYSALAVSKNENAIAFCEKLAAWRKLSRRVGVPELLHTLYLETGYYDYVGAQPGGLVRQANLRMLSDRAADYEKTSFRGLFRFLQFIRQMQKRETDLSAARTLGENEDVVRVMTVHMSKGLEYPVVVIADIGKKFNLRDTTNELLMHRSLGLGPYITQTQEAIKWRYPTFARQAVATRLTRESKAEEMRILYVALTRAREKLILTGNVGSLAKKAQKWVRSLQYKNTALPGYAVLEAKNWLDWIAPAVMRDEVCGEGLRAVAEYDDIVPPLPYDTKAYGQFLLSVDILPGTVMNAEEEEETPAEWAEDIRGQKVLPETKVGKEKKAVLDWVYPYATDTPSKFTVTEVKERMHEKHRVEADEEMSQLFETAPEKDRETDTEFPMPEFMRASDEANVKLTGAAYGTVMHHVLEKIDIATEADEESIAKAVGDMHEKGILSDEEYASVSIPALQAFFSSDIGQRLRAAKAVYREQPFSMLVDAERFGYTKSQSNEDMIFLQGVIDLFFEEADGSLVLVDYKTDRNTTPDIIRERYTVQVVLYKEALERATGKIVKECCIYRLANHDVVWVETL